MNQWDPSFGRRIICEKSTEEGDPAATEKRMGTRSTRHRRLSQRLPTNQRAPQREERQLSALLTVALTLLSRELRRDYISGI
jgi:hypothetical protein